MSSYLLIFSFSSLNICYGWLISIQAPFFPNEALSKGASVSQFSPVFGIIHAAMCFSSPFLGNWIRVLGVGRAFKLGVALPSITCILFGFLTYVPPNSTTVFLVLAYLLRLLEGLGGVLVWITTLTILLDRFPNSSSRVFALSEATQGLGIMSGPILGSFLFKAGGFLLPFVVSGVSMAVTGILSIFAIRDVVSQTKDKENNNKLSVKDLLHIPGVIAGWFTDKYFSPWLVCICGLLITLIGFILVGPSPYLPLSSSLSLTLFAVVLIGCGTGTTVVASSSSTIASALEAGFEETMDTYSIVSGVWTSAFSLGNFLGPTTGGFLYDQIGFAWGTVVIQIMAVLGITVNCCIRLHPRKSYEKLDGLNSSN